MAHFEEQRDVLTRHKHEMARSIPEALLNNQRLLETVLSVTEYEGDFGIVQETTQKCLEML